MASTFDSVFAQREIEQNNMQKRRRCVFVGVVRCVLLFCCSCSCLCASYDGYSFSKNPAKTSNFAIQNSKNHSCTYAVQSSKQSQFTPTDALIYRFDITIFVNCWCCRSHCARLCYVAVFEGFDFFYLFGSLVL